MIRENKEMLEEMYQGCNDREEEMKFTKLDEKKASKIEMLADKNLIRNNYKKLGKKKPALPATITESIAALRTLMDRERTIKVVVDDNVYSY